MNTYGFSIPGMLYERITLQGENFATHRLVIADCGDFLLSTSTALPMSSCNMPCSGNAAESCGGGNALLVFYSGVDPGPPPASPTVLPAYGQWQSLGCYTDSVAARTLLTEMVVAGGAVTPQRCMDACQSASSPFRFAGVEYAEVSHIFSFRYPPTNILPNSNAVIPFRARARHTPYLHVSIVCGNVISNGGAPATADGCDMACAGDATLLCGGPNRVGSFGEGFVRTVLRICS